MVDLSRRNLLIGSAATAAVAAMPAAAIAAVKEAPLAFMAPEWTPGRHIAIGEIVRINGVLHWCAGHVTADTPSERDSRNFLELAS
ncbi:hypothetical protein [Tardiphaga sp.]|jgi:hypothetical protein|uniref:hypothetical protein n=1 Tax=Tardiphaga sp. TaxID=1926292 RepID=UPI0037D9ABA0